MRSCSALFCALLRRLLLAQWSSRLSVLAMLAVLVEGSVEGILTKEDPRQQFHFPSSALVMEMMMLSDAVYQLRDKVESCSDPQRHNRTLLRALHDDWQDDGLASWLAPSGVPSGVPVGVPRGMPVGALRGSAQSAQIGQAGQADVFSMVLPPGATCLLYSHDRDQGRQVLIARMDPPGNSAGNIVGTPVGTPVGSGVGSRVGSGQAYIAVAYAGTDDWRTALTDGDILVSAFGPDHSNVTNATIGSNATNTTNTNGIFDKVPQGVKVHRGFNNAVFANDGFQLVHQCILNARNGLPCQHTNKHYNTHYNTYLDSRLDSNQEFHEYPIITTGHSLGGASAVLLATALQLSHPQELIQSINFGCPKIGNADWKAWVEEQLSPATTTAKTTMTTTKTTKRKIMTQPNNLKNNKTKKGFLEIYRFVHSIDLIPRLPELFYHAGHTIQMGPGKNNIKAYYNHVGDEQYGLMGVPLGWGASPYAFLPLAIAAHLHTHYLKYLQKHQPTEGDATNTYFQDFVRVNGDDGDDYYFPLADDIILLE